MLAYNRLRRVARSQHRTTTRLTEGVERVKGQRRYAGIPRRRHGHGHRHRLAKHGYNITSDTRYFLARPREKIACVGRKIVAVYGESVSVSVSVSASWNARTLKQLGRSR